jgi:hypothetical protein
MMQQAVPGLPASCGFEAEINRAATIANGFQQEI